MIKTSKSPSLTNLGRTLKAAREKQNKSQREFASDSSFQQAQIARAERGADLRVSTLIEYARALGLEVMLIPQAIRPAIEVMIGDNQTSEEKPLYALEQEP